MKAKALIAPSILAADFSRMGEEVAAVDRAGADWIHLDVMDAHFVPNLTFGHPLVKNLRKYSKKPFDAHLMISEPGKYAARFREAGADYISWHIECGEKPADSLKAIVASGAKAGVCLKPATPLSRIKGLLKKVDLVVVMSVEPGFGGQKFMAGQMPKVAELAKLRKSLNASYLIEVDGGVDDKTAPLCLEAGADVLVAGTAVYGKSNYKAAIRALRKP